MLSHLCGFSCEREAVAVHTLRRAVAPLRSAQATGLSLSAFVAAGDGSWKRASLLRAIGVSCSAALLSACASFSQDGGLGAVGAAARSEMGHDAVVLRTPEEASDNSARVAHLLSGSLTPAKAVEIALRSNRGLQAAYNRLGVAEAIKIRESLPPNPRVSLGGIAGSLSAEIEAAVAADILALATLPARAEIAADRFEAAQLEAAEATLRVAAEARRSYYRAVAARAQVRIIERIALSADVAAKLARQLDETGAMNRLDEARDQLVKEEIAAKLTTARKSEIAERERLVRALGLLEDNLSQALPAALPALPARPLATPSVEREAVEQRLDLQAARKELSALAKSLGLSSSTRFLDAFQLSALGKITREDVGSEKVQFNDAGAGATIEIPIFDLGETRVREAEQRWLEAANLLAERMVNVRSQAREAYQSYRAAHDIAMRHQRSIAPLHELISAESLKRYNAMIVDVFVLLEDARRRAQASIAAIEAKRDFWLADVELRVAIRGGGFPPAEGKAVKASVADNERDQP